MKKDLIILPFLWALLAFWWGDVLWLAAENSYFGGGGMQMHFLWSQPYGSLWIAGRLLLTACHIPMLGAALLAAMLTACAGLLRYTFRLRYGLEWLAVTAYLVWMAHEGFNLFYQNEPGRLFGIVLLALVLLCIEGLFLWSFRRRRQQKAVPRPAMSRRQAITARALLAMNSILPLALPMLVASPTLRPVCHMQRAMEQADWAEMSRTAQECSGMSNRLLAAYHAIAMVRQDNVLDKMCSITYKYDNVPLRDRAGLDDQSHNYFIVDCNFHAGLLQAAYHKAMESLTMEGPRVHLLKRMCQVAVMRGEKRLADKYLELLELEPFMDGFTTEWRSYNENAELLEAQPLVKSIRRLEPMHDTMEGMYAPPVFLGYNIALTEGRSPQALENSIAVCLYTKLVPAFMERVRYMDPQRLASKSVAMDALAMQAIKDPSIVQAIPSLQYNVARYQGFLNAMRSAGATGNTDARKPYADGMLSTWPSYYPAYYFFGNLDATVKGAARKYGYEGVN